MNKDIQWMQRALQLAEYGRGHVSPNPMVGCVIVRNDRIIGEGWHRQYGGPHAEVRAVEDVEKRHNGHLFSESTAYVTLEPCSHTGKTPPCADLLVRKGIKKVVVCNGDPNPLVSGRGIERLRTAGIEVVGDVLAGEGEKLNKRFFFSFRKKLPYVILKWAETADGYIAAENGQPVQISGVFSGVRVHKWRSVEDAILVGYNTARNDDPKLDVRHWKGRNPVRVVLDRHLRLPESLHLFDTSQPTFAVNYDRQTTFDNNSGRYSERGSIGYIKVNPGEDEILQLLQQLFKRGIQSILVEGGAEVLSAFLKAGLWNEIRRCQSIKTIGSGVKAPLSEGVLTGSELIQEDFWTYYVNT
ncbi:bifunctional diaminohydroxyphosphoribosylaminopyrimidine deaminase/5-amino-6-(5-phosphoribosylamino)uracil reductase RibD [Dyadobacter sp. LHD-138]|uniref:bifunctional diaminohydroxyphosphoribosylaminopyrimidine deaminase/5-amino-6-(5-phosphoribosylamino)uracil reductase RibD n=1 Tax=Dyadobacter sp. LHD-138 TaxID=3071413 RepID=UPI0027E05C92|nr:bifunctional diaminohydroxyphosphoribosylaminopyrimidine deaminase/5-amino-6-(5-phosphoribosylamino)uracil reductase RibD [Dyadobacter sp. LHD-138]MDQ6478480.1 bifunctional diaminohydroxyphosphoribosylaminopyrimidine deaminase/5-amino-6-(5-phosphoribosylamino)uracil reductase RibD [Dyadobacter sp. LHD-138]